MQLRGPGLEDHFDQTLPYLTIIQIVGMPCCLSVLSTTATVEQNLAYIFVAGSAIKVLSAAVSGDLQGRNKDNYNILMRFEEHSVELRVQARFEEPMANRMRNPNLIRGM